VAWNGELVGERGFFGEDQEQILNEYFNGCGRVVVSAGAGTGKTTLLVKIVAEAVVRLLKADPNQNPFQKILAVTFTVEATRQMKTKIKKQLEQHFKAIGQPEKIRDLVRWIESESWILTLDSLTRTLLSEVAYDLGLSSIATVPDEYELGKIREEIIQEIKSNDDLVNEVQLVESVFPDEEWRGERGWVGVLEELFQKARMYCLSAKELGERAFQTFEKRVYQGLKPPFDEEKIREICKAVYNEKLKNKKNSAKITPKMVNESYEFNRKILEAFINLLEEYERLYDEKTKPKGMLGHDDARYWIVRYASGKIKNANHLDAWLQTQRNRFKHILVDEFQDTSYAQCELLKHFIGEDTKVFLIGDPKQAIYQWRTAEPEIFIKILDKIREEGESGKLPFLEVSGFKSIELTGNFRSHPALIEMFNDIFGDNRNSIFNDTSYTGGKDLPHGDLKANTELPSESVEEPHIHVYNEDCWNAIPKILEAIRDRRFLIHVRSKDANGDLRWKEAELGDCCILMQTRSKWPLLRKELINRKINYVMIAEKGLFQRPEISLIIDVLDWFANPHNKDSLIRILRSPITGLSERALRFLAYHNFSIHKALTDREKPHWFEDEAEALLRNLVKLRDDLRWLREGRKTRMIEEIIRFAHLDVVLLTHPEGEQCLANLWALLDIVSSWEQEELLPYNELVERLKYYREYGENAYNMAILADEEDRNSVKIATVHATKGLGFPIVFIFYPQSNFVSQWNKQALPNMKVFIKNQGNFVLIQQASPPTVSSGWENYLRPQNNLKIPPPYKLFDSFNIENLSEKWRLYYVALTRAKDHVFHSIKRLKKLSKFRWQYVFLKWFERNKTRYHLDIMNLTWKGSIKGLSVTANPDLESYNFLSEKGSSFTPRVINPSHLYDLFFCPRRYQYVVLQRVSGGESCIYPSGRRAALLGTRVHYALQLRNFSSKAPNATYAHYIETLERTDRSGAKKVREMVESFMNSDFYKDYRLDKARVKKEMEILFELKSNNNSQKVLMSDKIDLVIKGEEGVVIVDYKTNYPTGDGFRAEYEREHNRCQLQAYALALEKGLGTKVQEAVILYYDGAEWKLEQVEVNASKMEKAILDKLVIKVEDGGLKKKPKDDFCEDHCEFSELCK